MDDLEDDPSDPEDDEYASADEYLDDNGPLWLVGVGLFAMVLQFALAIFESPLSILETLQAMTWESFLSDHGIPALGLCLGALLLGLTWPLLRRTGRLRFGLAGAVVFVGLGLVMGHHQGKLAERPELLLVMALAGAAFAELWRFFASRGPTASKGG